MILEEQEKLMNQRSLTVSKYYTERNQLKNKNTLEMRAQISTY